MFILRNDKDVYDFSDQIFDLSYLVMPPSYVGRWRARIELKIQTENGQLEDCFYMYGDVDLQ